MAENGTTSIDQLPVNPQISSNNNLTAQFSNNGLPQQIQSNVNETQNIKIENYGQQLNAERSVDPMVQQLDYGSQLNATLKDIGSSGATALPSRDIPQNTIHMQQDIETKPNHVPNKSNDYIGDILDKEEILKNNTRKNNQADNLDYIYEQLQIPIIVSILYFIFQLPAIRKHIFSFLPSLFNNDGNPNFYGYVFNSLIFGGLYYGMNKGLISLKNF